MAEGAFDRDYKLQVGLGWTGSVSASFVSRRSIVAEELLDELGHADSDFHPSWVNDDAVDNLTCMKCSLSVPLRACQVAAVDVALATIFVKRSPGRLAPSRESSRMLATRSPGSRRSFREAFNNGRFYIGRRDARGNLNLLCLFDDCL